MIEYICYTKVTYAEQLFTTTLVLCILKAFLAVFLEADVAWKTVW